MVVSLLTLKYVDEFYSQHTDSCFLILEVSTYTYTYLFLNSHIKTLRDVCMLYQLLEIKYPSCMFAKIII